MRACRELARRVTLKEKCPNVRFGIVERRKRIGGTWDLFRYPGIRSDSDMFTLGYNFRPWTDTKMLADGPSIRRYIDDTAREYDVKRRIQFGLKVISQSWHSEKKHWIVKAIDEATDEEHQFSTGFVFHCTGYYKYDSGYTPEIRGSTNSAGDVIHPQHWPENYDYTGKRVVVIGSGATARDAGSGYGRQGGSCSDAAALAHLCSHRAGAGSDIQEPAPHSAGDGRLPGWPGPAIFCCKERYIDFL